jgi:hypothetical protein
MIVFLLRCGHVLPGYFYEKVGHRLYCEKCKKLVEITVVSPVRTGFEGSQEKANEKNSDVRSRNG